jgi:hypothetical protein
MLKITIEGVGNVDGGYDLDLTYFTNRELNTIKKVADVRAGQLQEALTSGDNDVIVAFTLIALQRDGKNIDPELLWNAKAGAITVENIEDEDGDASELAKLPPPKDGGLSGTAVASESSSGASSTTSSESRASGQSRIGSLG